jgi:hypothetical protein
MTFMPLAVAAALLLVIATRGSLLRLGVLPFRGLGMLFAGLGIQVLLAVVHIPHSRLDDVGFGLLIASYALILTFGFTNLHVRGMTIVALGVALNALVIALNQGMPANGPTRTAADGNRVSRVITSVKHRPERPGDLLTPLDDRIELPRPSHDLLSFGDLILVAGLLDVCYWGSRRDDEAWMSVFFMPIPAPTRRSASPSSESSHDTGQRTDPAAPWAAAREGTGNAAGSPNDRDDTADPDDTAEFLAFDDDVIDLREVDAEAGDAHPERDTTARQEA